MEEQGCRMPSIMRLRSSQFVFLLLIACSVQIREERALRWIEQAISGGSTRTFVQREAAADEVRPNSSAEQVASRLAPLGLLPSALAVRREPWAMPHPASASAAVVACTGLFRA